jgi:tetratricopeptide (TPR) repeat protein
MPKTLSLLSIVLVIFIPLVISEETAYLFSDNSSQPLGYANLSEYNGSGRIIFALASGSDSIGTLDKTKLTSEDYGKIFAEKVDTNNDLVNDEAAYLAQKFPGERSIDQVCSVFDYLKSKWNYTSDRRGVDYFRYANQTLQLGKRAGLAGAGDCDDFAILMSALVEGLGGTTRIIIAHGPKGAHAYAEVYLGSANSEEVQNIIAWIKKRYGIDKVYYHLDFSNDDLWLNLDWSAKHPGGPFYEAPYHTPIYVMDIEKTALNPANKPPVAVIYFAPSHPSLGEEIIFTSGSMDPDGSIEEENWELGDGATGSGNMIKHCYSKSGNYKINLSVFDNKRSKCINSTTITINEPPFSCFSIHPKEPKVKDIVTFDASASSDKDGGIVSYEWEFGDGDTGKGISKLHTYQENGSYNVILTVKDDHDAKNTTISIIKINAPPVAAFTFSPSGPSAGDSISFDASQSKDPDGKITDYEWIFGDGDSGNGIYVLHNYSIGGNYLVELKIKDDSNATDIRESLVKVNRPAIASISYYPTSPRMEEKVTFDASQSADPDGKIVDYEWKFGDGYSANGDKVKHTYLEVGNFTVTLILTDNKGKKTSSSISILARGDKRLAEDWIRTGATYSKSGRHEDAVICFNKAIEFDPESANAYISKSASLINLGKFEEANISIEKALDIEPYNATIWMVKGGLLVILGEHQGALESFNNSLEIDPNNSDIWSFKGTVLLMLGKYEEANSCFDESLKINPNNPTTWNSKSTILNFLGRYDDAQVAYNRAEQLSDHSIGKADFWYAEGKYLSKNGKYEEAIRNFDKAIEIDSQNASIWIAKSNAFNAMRRYEEAIQSCEKAIELDPLNTTAWNDKGFANIGLGKFEISLQFFDKAIELDPLNSVAWNNKGFATMSLGKYEESLNYFDKAINIDQANANAWNNKGFALMSLNRNEESLKYFDKAIEIDPFYGTTWSNKAVALNNLGRFEEVIECSDRAIELNPFNENAWNNKGVGLFNLGRYDEAIQCYDKSIEINPSFLMAQINRETAKMKLNSIKGNTSEYESDVINDIDKNINYSFRTFA